jgi:itaconate CoA-transferase
MMEWMSYPLYYAMDGASPPPRAGAAHATIYPYGPFPAGDGRVIMLGLQNEREWALFCSKVLGQPELATDPRFSSNAARTAAREELRAIIVEVFSKLTAEQVIERLEAAPIANAHMNTMHDMWEHPQLKARGRWSEVATPAGPLPALKPPGVPEEWDARMDPIPALGAHTEAILVELGYDAGRIAALREQQTI